MKEYLPWISIGCTVLGFAIMYLKYIVSLETRLVALETKMSLFWDSVGGVVKDIFKQPIHFHKDDLIDRFPDTLNDKELLELETIVTDEIKELAQVKDTKAIVGGILLYEIKQEKLRRKDKKCLNSLSGWQRLVCKLQHWFTH